MINKPNTNSPSILVLAISMLVFIGVGLFAGYFIAPHEENMMHFASHDMEEMRTEFISEKEMIMSKMMAEGNYACCLEKPCTYCIEKTPGHGEDAACRCLDDIMNGVHPCGECIGEILEGHGNRFLAPYFAEAIAEKVGIAHLPTLQMIISEKYDIAINEQS